MCVPKALLPQPTPARAHFRFFPSQVSSWPAASTPRGAALLGALVWCWASGTFAATPGAAGTEPSAGGPTAVFRASPETDPASWAARGRITLDLPGLVQLSLLYNASVQAARLQSAATAQLLNGEQALYEPALVEKIKAAFLALDPANPEHKAILDLQAASRFIPTKAENYQGIEQAARAAGLLQ